MKSVDILVNRYPKTEKTIDKRYFGIYNKNMKKVLVGMSGGVDSSVAAFLLQKSGYEVIGLHFTLTGKTGDLSDLNAVAKRLGIKYYVEDFSEIFDKNVFKPFIKEYENGNTPNICVLCNKYIKFGALYEKANELGCDYVATGHYCDVEKTGGKTYLKKAKDSNKDQTYFLSMISPSALAKTLFPLSGIDKTEVRKIAEDNEIPTAKKKDSSDVCLAEGGKFSDFLQKYVHAKSGAIVSLSGEIVGKHNGLYRYTLGQRKGLNLGGKSGEDGRWFVVKKDGETNTLYVSHGSEDLLMKNSFVVESPNFLTEPLSTAFDCTVKTRYRADYKCAHVEVSDGKLIVTLSEPERAITVGQYAVFYDGDVCLGGGRISSVL